MLIGGRCLASFFISTRTKNQNARAVPTTAILPGLNGCRAQDIVTCCGVLMIEVGAGHQLPQRLNISSGHPTGFALSGYLPCGIGSWQSQIVLNTALQSYCEYA
jgi:hypothetical protein